MRFVALESMQIMIADFAGVSRVSVIRILRKVPPAIAQLRPQFAGLPQIANEMRAASDLHLRLQTP